MDNAKLSPVQWSILGEIWAKVVF